MLIYWKVSRHVDKNALHEKKFKKYLRFFWRAALTAHAFIASLASVGCKKFEIKVFYGGVQAKDLGGPGVKIKRLSGFFPSNIWRFNLIYLLSNAPYLSSAALWWYKKFNFRIVLNQNGVFYPGWYSGDWEAQNSTMAIAYHVADYVFWQSDFCRRSADKFLGVRKGPGEVLFNAIDINHFKPVGQKLNSQFSFLITGKIDRHMNYRLKSTIEGLACVRKDGYDFKLIIAGWVEDSAELELFAKDAGVSESVLFLSSYTQENAPNIYQSAHAYVITKYLDPCPNSVLEAMACGLPILFSNSGGVPELVGSDAGFGIELDECWEKILVPTAQSIAEGMQIIYKKHDSMAKAARARAEQCFDISKWVQRHQIIFEELLKK